MGELLKMPKWEFQLYSTNLEQVREHTFKIPAIVVEAPTKEEAWELVKPQIPADHRLFCLFELTPELEALRAALDKQEQI